MLSCILNSERAIHVNIQIIRIYTRIREMVMAHKDVFIKVERVEKQLMKQDQKIALLFTYLSKFIEKKISREQQLALNITFGIKGNQADFYLVTRCQSRYRATLISRQHNNVQLAI